METKQVSTFYYCVIYGDICIYVSTRISYKILLVMLQDELSAIAGEDEKRDEPAPAAPAHPSPSQTGGSQVALLRERLAMYQEAEANAKAGGETARARRYDNQRLSVEKVILLTVCCHIG